MSNCYADPNPIFQPAMRLIESITQSDPAVVTTTFAHQYESLLVVRFDIPFADGMQQLNKQVATITVLGDTTFSVPIDTTHYDAFSIPGSASPSVQVCAMVVPVGEDNSMLSQATRNVLNPNVILITP